MKSKKSHHLPRSYIEVLPLCYLSLTLLNQKVEKRLSTFVYIYATPQEIMSKSGSVIPNLKEQEKW